MNVKFHFAATLRLLLGDTCAAASVIKQGGPAWPGNRRQLSLRLDARSRSCGPTVLVVSSESIKEQGARWPPASHWASPASLTDAPATTSVPEPWLLDQAQNCVSRRRKTFSSAPGSGSGVRSPGPWPGWIGWWRGGPATSVRELCCIVAGRHYNCMAMLSLKVAPDVKGLPEAEAALPQASDSWIVETAQDRP